MKNAIVVTGSLNMDFVVAVDCLPAPGQTVLGSGFRTIPGGKGANQANAAGKLAQSGLIVKMLGRTGYDAFADQLKASLSASGVDVSGVHASRSNPTGIAMIGVESTGQNSIIVAPGANQDLSVADMEMFRAQFRAAKVALFQLETPLDTVARAMAISREEGAVTILDPAPAQQLPRDILEAADYITPNESEALVLLGRPPADVALDDAPEIAEAIAALGPKKVVLKLGSKGCFYFDGSYGLVSPGFKVQAVDTTAAGDTFNAAFAVALAEEKPIDQALRFANASAAISVTRAGAQTSAPQRADVDQFLA